MKLLLKEISYVSFMDLGFGRWAYPLLERKQNRQMHG